jgi:D-alanyl-lipoteichoic acid acyltransferase DltB (MBOAT superfamily)
MFYPQLVAGPIERPAQLLPQLHRDIPFRYENLWQGLRLMLWGLFKKTVIADRLGGYVDPIFNHPGAYHNLQLAAAAFAFTIQLYCDFSGYTDIALGTARCMGIDLVINFNRPFFATNIAAFWRRWHISLLSWFTDYLYMPMVIALRDWGRAAVVVGLFATFLVCGLWHGSSPHYVFWGLSQAVFLVIYFFSAPYLRHFKGLIWDIPASVLTFLAVSFSMVFFRAENMSAAWTILGRIFSADPAYHLYVPLDYFPVFSILISVLMIAYMLVVESFTDPRMAWFEGRLRADILFSGITLFLLLSLGFFDHQRFIYFQF